MVSIFPFGLILLLLANFRNLGKRGPR